ncbi:MAG: Flp pilus assembly complex ATPase component TadA [Deltaproteobacteria bacterium]|jgi:defect-in-organelle-trafficking protein DotB|nr:Flp pilus assembly complex ATPase component TadA [Deltaproteobacteria bacterium]
MTERTNLTHRLFLDQNVGQPLTLNPDGQPYSRRDLSQDYRLDLNPDQRPQPSPVLSDAPHAPRSGETFPWPPEEALDLKTLDRLLAWGIEANMSDLVLTTGQTPWLRRDGTFQAIGFRALTAEETTGLLEGMTNNEAAAALVGSGRDLDFSYEIGQRGQKKRFRGNATAIQGRLGALCLVLRAIAGKPPRLSQLELEPELRQALFPADGLVLVTGVMGSGKSSLLAAALRDLAETGGRHIATYEAPVEFDLTDPENLRGPVEQTEIPTHLPAFHLAPKNAARRAADVVLVGESRDKDTLKSLIEAAGLGVTAYATAHTRGVAETPLHLINLFEPKERAAMGAELLSSLRLIVQQRLFPKVGGGRIAVREFLAFNAPLRRSLQKAPLPELEETLTQLVATKGQSLLTRAEQLTRSGYLAPDILQRLQLERGAY